MWLDDDHVFCLYCSKSSTLCGAVVNLWLEVTQCNGCTASVYVKLQVEIWGVSL